MLGEGLRELLKMRSNPPRPAATPPRRGVTHPGLRPPLPGGDEPTPHSLRSAPLPGGDVSLVADQAGSWAFADIHHQGL